MHDECVEKLKVTKKYPSDLLINDLSNTYLHTYFGKILLPFLKPYH